MTDADRDSVLRRAIDELKRLPDADPEAIRRVVQSAAAARVAPADEEVLIERPRRSVRPWSIAGLAAAAAIVGFVARGAWTYRTASPAPGSTVSVAAVADVGPLRAMSSTSEIVAVPQTFVFRSATAHRVAVVGDFNEWNPSSAPMVHAVDGTWSVIIPVYPGRHLYGFMIDDSTFVLDPRAQTARDPDLGTEGSVIMVGRP